MRFLIWEKWNFAGPITHKVLCTRATCVEIIDNQVATELFKGHSLLDMNTKFVGLANSAEDAKNRYPEYFL